MAKALNIKDPAISALAQELARRTGATLTQAVGDAVRARLDEVRRVEEAKRAAWAERMREAALPADFSFERDDAPPEDRARWP